MKTFFSLLVYNSIFILMLPFILLVFLIQILFDKNVREGHAYRLGFKRPKKRKAAPTILIHAVSVGEISGIRDFVRLIQDDNKYDIYLSTTTATGFDMGRKIYGESVQLFYFPLDLPWLIRRLYRRIKPEKIIIAEIEIWPNFIHAGFKRNIPVYLINGRIGESEQRGYRRGRFLLRPFYEMYSAICAQSSIDAERMKDIGMPKEKIYVLGNLKYDVSFSLDDNKSKTLRALLPKKEHCIVCGSTHAPEETYILDAYNAVKERFDSSLVIVPRDISRSTQICKLAESRGISTSLRSTGKTDGEILIVDTIGELLYFYSFADIVIMGGSFSKRVGGHNILEAAYFKKPIIVGPCMHNFEEMNDEFETKHGIYTIKNQDEIEHALKTLFKNTAEANLLGTRAYKVLTKNKGSARRTYEAIFKE